MSKKPMRLIPRLRLSSGLMMAVLVSFGVSACGARETPPKPVSDFCLIDKTVSLSIAPQPGLDDPGNRYDSEETVAEVMAHNQRWRAVCDTHPPDT